ncbi:3-mercaptopyruvate sulfurtransferase [Yersinia nurmii]|uniref:Sulfurtransferase n=1 Tax=Yersinia nurmii TaxID=685706 RepID=A0AAW7K8C9_9GAMM|nr:3-mercaptopyruvate sulfurtransferase [Yersinia nurmii]MDN0087954.1 3-mercaptopyruvate sulfurtransferase [Yersinia nurmii]CND96456.1 putative sulfurtransferase [Yersinia nurmii]
MNPSFLVSPHWLAEHLDDKQVVILDARLSPPGLNPKRDIQAEFEQGHIPGAVFFNIDEVSDHNTSLPHMLPSAEAFGEAMGKLGINDQHTIVLYDDGNLFSAPRGWWTFRTFGARDVRVLEGGIEQWKQAGLPLASGSANPEPQWFTATLNEKSVKNSEQVLAAIDEPDTQILDARPAPRFAGAEPEPRPGLRLGHIPGSINIPWGLMVEQGQLKSPEILRDIFQSNGVDLEKPIIVSCGSGVTAAVLALGLHAVKARSVSLYDGSWAEWGASDFLPVEVSAR